MLGDTLGRQRVPVLDTHQVLPRLEQVGTAAALGLRAWLEQQAPSVVEDLAGYTLTRYEASQWALDQLLRTEEEAIADFQQISTEIVRTYGTRLETHHQSSKVMVQTVAAITNAASAGRHPLPDDDPQSRVVELGNGSVWASPRRLDGALPSLLNPTGIWEIKEYWGGTSGGSKMSDAVYEIQLVGTELALRANHPSRRIKHYAIIDGRNQWLSRRSDLRRLIDLLYCGLIDELIIGREVV